MSRLKVDFDLVTAGAYGSVDTGDYLSTIYALQAAKKADRLAVLYLFDSTYDRKKGEAFEEQLFGHENLAIGIKPFLRLKLDVSQDSVAKDRYGPKVPCVIVYDAKGQAVETAELPGYKANANIVLNALMRASKGHAKLSLKSFISKYRRFLTDLEKLEKRKEVLADKAGRMKSESKLKRIDKQFTALAKQKKALLDRELDLLTAVKAWGTQKDPDAPKAPVKAADGAKPAAKPAAKR